jgi:hypothetical protein
MNLRMLNPISVLSSRTPNKVIQEEECLSFTSVCSVHGQTGTSTRAGQRLTLRTTLEILLVAVNPNRAKVFKYAYFKIFSICDYFGTPSCNNNLHSLGATPLLNHCSHRLDVTQTPDHPRGSSSFQREKETLKIRVGKAPSSCSLSHPFVGDPS